MSPVTRLYVGFALMTVAASGCGAPPPLARVPVTGTVTLDGKPLATGTIVFEPKGNLPTRSGGPIQAGRFDVPLDQGPVPGSYAVAIFGGPVDPEAAAQFKGDVVRDTDPIYAKIREIVPRKYNVQTVLEVEVRAGEANEFRFDLSPDKPKR